MRPKEIEGVPLDTYAGKAIAALRTKLYGVLSDNGSDIIVMLDAVRYNMLFNAFAAKGYFITADNQEEKYVEILSAGDNDLLTLLEEYVTYRELMENHTNKVDEYHKLVDAIKMLDPNDTQAINDVVKSYLTV